jgi:hypothetical protein
VAELLALARTHGVHAEVAGRVLGAGDPLRIAVTGTGGDEWNATWWPAELRAAYFDAIPRRMRALSRDVLEGR